MLELRDLRPQRRVARLRLLRDALEPTLDVVAIRDEQLELQRLEIGCGLARAGPAVEHREQRVDLPQVPEQRGARTGHVDDANRGRRDLLRADDSRELLERASGIGAIPTCSFPTPLASACVSARNSVVEPAFGRPTIPTCTATR